LAAVHAPAARTIIAAPPPHLEIAMSLSIDILAAARSRLTSSPYAGAVSPQEAYALLQADVHVKLIDVRTDAERDWVGRVAINEAQHGAVQWNTYPAGVQNADFLVQLAAVADKQDVLLFLCRSGVRSRHAAKLATENGYAQCFDILEGFEGDKDAHGHRKHIGGWCKAGLPWVGA
jgi:rhodanese-related sulfurtransferase